MDNRSRWQIFKEDVLRIRVVPNNGKDNDIQVTAPKRGLVDLLDAAYETGGFINLSDINKLRTISNDREFQYRLFDDMKLDSIISSALELYSDDATQYNRDGNIIWVKSDDPNIAAFGNRLIDVLGLNKDAWSHIYSLCLYGDLYLETFSDDEIDESDPLVQKYSGNIVDRGSVTLVKDPKNGYRLVEYIQMVNNPAELFDITKYGKTIGFAKIASDVNDDQKDQLYYKSGNLQADDKVIYNPRKFIHVSLSQDVERFPEKISISFPSTKKLDDGRIVRSKNTSDIVTAEYIVKRGRSILYNVFRVYQELKLLEDAILLNRVTRSSIIRLLQVEVGDMTKSQVSNLLHRLKEKMEQRQILDKNQGYYKSQASPGPIDNIIYIPTRNGKGQISMSNVGGDVDVKSIADIDYFKNKLFGGLKIPKQFLGEDEGGGFSGGTSLTKLDARYARTIKRIQNAYSMGVTTLINIYALDRGLDGYVNNFTVCMTSPSTTEDSERDENMSVKMGLISDFIELMGDAYSLETKKKIMEYFVSTYIDDPELTKILNEDVPESPDMTQEEGDFGDAQGSEPNTDIDVDINAPSDNEPIESTEPEFQGTTEPANFNASSNDFGDFEGELTGNEGNI